MCYQNLERARPEMELGEAEGDYLPSFPSLNSAHPSPNQVRGRIPLLPPSQKSMGGSLWDRGVTGPERGSREEVHTRAEGKYPGA